MRAVIRELVAACESLTQELAGARATITNLRIENAHLRAAVAGSL